MAVVQQQGMRLLVDSVESSTENAYLDLVRAKRIDGLILIDAPGDDPAVQRLAQDDFPIVTLGYNHPSPVRLMQIIARGHGRQSSICWHKAIVGSAVSLTHRGLRRIQIFVC